MLKRNNEIKVRLTQGELDLLNEKVKKTSMSREQFVRKAISGTVIKEAPPVEYYGLMCELRRLGFILNQLLKEAISRDCIDVTPIREALEGYRKTENMIWKSFREEQS